MRKGMRHIGGNVTNLTNVDMMRNLTSTKKQLICLKVMNTTQQKQLYNFIREFGVFNNNCNRIIARSNIGKYIAFTINNSTSSMYLWYSFNVYGVSISQIENKTIEKHNGVGVIDYYTSFKKFKHTMLTDSGIINASSFYMPRKINKLI